MISADKTSHTESWYRAAVNAENATPESDDESGKAFSTLCFDCTLQVTVPQSRRGIISLRLPIISKHSSTTILLQIPPRKAGGDSRPNRGVCRRPGRDHNTVQIRVDPSRHQEIGSVLDKTRRPFSVVGAARNVLQIFCSSRPGHVVSHPPSPFEFWWGRFHDRPCGDASSRKSAPWATRRYLVEHPILWIGTSPTERRSLVYRSSVILSGTAWATRFPVDNIQVMMFDAASAGIRLVHRCRIWSAVDAPPLPGGAESAQSRRNRRPGARAEMAKRRAPPNKRS